MLHRPLYFLVFSFLLSVFLSAEDSAFGLVVALFHSVLSTWPGAALLIFHFISFLCQTVASKTRCGLFIRWCDFSFPVTLFHLGEACARTGIICCSDISRFLFSISFTRFLRLDVEENDSWESWTCHV